MLIHFEIATPERAVLKEEIQQITAPTTAGEITVLPRHISLVSVLKPGVLEIKTATGEIETMAVAGGFIEVLPDKVVVLADSAQRAMEIDEAAAEQAKERAEQLMAEQTEHTEIATTEAQLAHAVAQLNAVKRYKTIRSRS